MEHCVQYHPLQAEHLNSLLTLGEYAPHTPLHKHIFPPDFVFDGKSF